MRLDQPMAAMLERVDETI